MSNGMEGKTSPRTAIVVGAGCSRGLGVPTMPDFMDTAFSLLAEKSGEIPALGDTLEILIAFTQYVKGSAASISTRFLDVEELYGLAEMARDLGAFKERPLKSRTGKSFSGEQLLQAFNRTLMYVAIEAGRELVENKEYKDLAKQIERVKRESQTEDPGTFTDRGSRHANLLAYLTLASFRDQESDSYPLIVQFNWDLAYDRALFAIFDHNDHGRFHGLLEQHKLGWCVYAEANNHDFREFPLLLRPHGGLYFQNKTDNDEGWEDRMVRDESPSLYVYERALIEWTERPRKDEYGNGNGNSHRIGDHMEIMPPTWKKNVTQFREQWQQLLSYLKMVRRIVFIGFSLPRSDLYMRHFLGLALANADYVPKVYVWNPGMKPGEDTWKNYCDTFEPLRREGRLYAIDKPFGDPALFDLERAMYLAKRVEE